MIFIYNALFILLYGLILGRKIELPKYKKKFLLICCIQMVLIQGLRSIETGTDTSMYVNTYNNYQNSEVYSFQFTHFEYGFQFLYNFLKQWNASSQVLLIVISSVTMFGFSYFIYKNSENAFISLFVFACMFYPNSFNIMRQYLALAIAINAFQFLVEKKYVKSIVIILIASLFHLLAILMLLPVIFFIVKNWKTVRNILSFLTLIFLAFGNQIVSYILRFVGKGYYLTGYNVMRFFRMTTAFTFLIAFISWYFQNNIKDDEIRKKIINVISCIMFVNMLCGILYLRYEFISRIIEIFNLFLMISVPLWINTCKKRYKKIFKTCCLFICILWMINSVYNSGSGVESYAVFWSNN